MPGMDALERRPPTAAAQTSDSKKSQTRYSRNNILLSLLVETQDRGHFNGEFEVRSCLVFRNRFLNVDLCVCMCKQELGGVMHRFDKDGDGTVDIVEFTKTFFKLGFDERSRRTRERRKAEEARVNKRESAPTCSRGARENASPPWPRVWGEPKKRVEGAGPLAYVVHGQLS